MTHADRNEPDLLTRPVSRRGALVLLGGLGLAVAGCSGGSDSTDATATTKGASSSTSTTSGAHDDDRRLDRGHRDRLHADPRGDRRSVPGRRLERTRRPRRERRRPQGHHHQLRRQERHRRRRALHDAVHGRERRRRLQADDRRGDLRVALRPRRQLLDVPERERPELPARGAGARRQRRRHLHQHLPRVLLGSMAARALRGVPERLRRHERDQQARHVAARVPGGHLRGGVRNDRDTSPARATCRECR